MQMLDVSLENLHAHPANSNVMPDGLFEKLRTHMQRTKQYPPIVVRKTGEQTYQILDGHHRVKALAELGEHHAKCVIWQVDDQQALVLLATLNRLQGRDDPKKRAGLLAQLNASVELKELAAQLPEDLEQLEKLLTLNAPAIEPRAAESLEQMPVAVHFFLLPEQRRALDRALKTIGGSREAALMSLANSIVEPGDAA